MPRPSSLDPLFRSLHAIKGVGPQLSALLTRFFGAPEGQEAIALDLLMHMPSGIVDRTIKWCRRRYASWGASSGT